MEQIATEKESVGAQRVYNVTLTPDTNTRFLEYHATFEKDGVVPSMSRVLALLAEEGLKAKGF